MTLTLLARLLVLVVALVVIGTHREAPRETAHEKTGVQRPGLIASTFDTLRVAGASSRAPIVAAPTPGPTPDASDVTWQGIASHMGSAPVPAWYLAIPKGPGYRVRLCGPVRCIDVTSTDAGPSLAMQRAGRVADLSVALFERVCDCPSSVGLINVSVTIERRAVLPTLPPTETAP